MEKRALIWDKKRGHCLVQVAFIGVFRYDYGYQSFDLSNQSRAMVWAGNVKLNIQ